MKLLKPYTYLLACFLPLSIVQCGSSQNSKAELTSPTWTDTGASFNKWIAGVQEGGSGIDLVVHIEQLPGDVKLEKAFFRNRAAPLVPANPYFKAQFKDKQPTQPDVIMHDNPLEEAVNTPETATLEKFPFTLVGDEVGISYRKGDKLFFTKIIDVEDKGLIAYPSAPPRDGGH